MSKQSERESKSAAHFVSMTGYGRAQKESEGIFLEVEIRTVNSRYLDLNFRTPRSYSIFEPKLRKVLSDTFRRGRVDINVQRRVTSVDDSDIEFNQSLLEALKQKYANVLGDLFSKDPEIEADALLQILNRREVLDPSCDRVDEEKEGQLLIEVARSALEKAGELREEEGARLADDFVSRIVELERIKSELAVVLENARDMLAERVRGRIEKITTDLTLDEGRLEQEVAYLADKADVSEELVRLDSHFAQMRKLMGKSPNGRKLEFMLQELGREFNTVSSKAQNAQAQGLVVDAKGEIERIREQLQNVE